MTEDEARDKIIEAARGCIRTWQGETRGSCEDRISGVIHSFLATLDGVGHEDLMCDLMVIESNAAGEKTSETRVSTMLHENLYPPRSGA